MARVKNHGKFLIVFLLLFGSQICASGSMWPVYDIDRLPLDSLKTAGLRLSAGDIYNPGGTALADAVVRLGGGTASFISPTGLLITNHHVAFGAIQRQSSVNRNYITEGFYAATRAEEIPAIGYDAMVTLEIQDVTERFADVIESSSDAKERSEAIEKRIKEIIAETEKSRDVECKIAKMYGDRQFILYTYFKIKDIRVVYAPPEAIGNYGGDIDNWMWPRHVGDFAFVRAYVAPDGSAAEYSPDNVPYRPKKFLPISSAGVNKGDVSLMIGYPGKTHRYASSYEIQYLIEDYYPLYLETSQMLLEILNGVAAIDPELKIRLSSTESGINNYFKKTKGIVKGFLRGHLYDTKKRQELQLIEHLANNRGMAANGTTLIKRYAPLFAEKRMSFQKDFYLQRLPGSCQSLDMAIKLYKWAVEREKDDLDRDLGYQDRDIENAIENFKTAQINLVPEYDRRVIYYFLDKMLALPENQRIAAIDDIVAGRDADIYLQQYVDYLFARSTVGELDSRLKMFAMSKADLENLNDPMINLAIVLMPEIEALKERDKAFDNSVERLDAELTAAYVALGDRRLHPDANSTKRVNWGIIEGYAPADAVVYGYQSYLTGVMEKETGEEPFIVPGKLKDTWEKRSTSRYLDKSSGDVPVNFVSSNSGTNGNSGSPLINGSGELIGIDFDTCIDGVAADYYHNPNLARSIVVDSRYMLYIIDEVYGLQKLLQEMTIH